MKITIPFRSPGFVPGCTDLLLHFHIDVPEEEVPKLIAIVRYLVKLGYICSIDRVRVSIAGPQRKKIPWMYDLHNVPGDIEGGETLGAFASILVKDRADLIYVIKLISPMLAGITGGILEAELPVGLYTKDGWKLLFPKSNYPLPIKSDEIDFAVQRSMHFETHHWLSLPKNGPPPVSLESWSKFLAVDDISDTGGFFILDGEAIWGYATNSFSDEEDFQQRIEKEAIAHEAFLRSENLPCDSFESLVEWIILVAKTESIMAKPI